MNPLSARLRDYFYGGVDPVRPYLLQKAVLLLLAFDCWIDLIPHGARYGAGGFNVTHFEVLTALLPVPTSAVYVGLLSAVGALAFVLVFVRPPRMLLVALTLGYSASWMLSMLDSYQHHYLLTLLLISISGFPRLDSRFLGEVTPTRWSRALGYTALQIAGLGIAARLVGFDAPGMALLEFSPRSAWAVLLGVLMLGAFLIFVGTESSDAKGRPAKKSSGKKSAKRKSAEKKAAQKGNKASRAPSWAYVSFVVTCAIVYFYTAITKTARDWRDGHVLRRVARGAFREVAERWVADGWTLDDFWSFQAKLAIALQLVICVALLVAARQDVMKNAKVRAVIALSVVAPLGFHVGAEMMELKIGWFSYYMIIISLIVFAPASWLRAVAIATSAPAHFARSRLGGRVARGEPAASPRSASPTVSPTEQLVVVAMSLCLLIGMGAILDLPGAALAIGVVAILIAVAAYLDHRAGSDVRAYAVGALIAAAALFLSVTQTEVRFDYYRLGGGEYRRMGELEIALEHYVKANRYAPEDRDRRRQEAEVRAELERRR